LINISKIINDKYYTSSDLAEYCVNKTEKIIGKDNITEYLEPSAGNGVFLDYLQKTYKAYDIDPEDNRIVKQDYLQLDIPYKQGRCIIGNPPYGNRNVLSVQFYKKSIQLGDYISFILPISQLNNNQQMYEFNMVYSEDLGIKQYSGRDVHCCFNIYKRPKNGLNQKPKYKLKDVNIIEVRQGNKVVNDYDLRICNFGAATGKEVLHENQYAHELCIIINNTKYKTKIINLLKSTDWKNIYYMTATPALYQWQIYKYIKEQIPEIN
jgi:hypothetical protein